MHETNISVPQQEKQTDATESEVTADYNPDVDYKPEGPDPKIKAFNEKKNSDAEYVKWNYLKSGHCPRG